MGDVKVYRRFIAEMQEGCPLSLDTNFAGQGYILPLLMPTAVGSSRGACPRA
jgi:hypothetical protein